jgi:hypothetical protein
MIDHFICGICEICGKPTQFENVMIWKFDNEGILI